MKGLAKISESLREIANVLVEGQYLTRREADELASQILAVIKGIMNKKLAFAGQLNIVDFISMTKYIPVKELIDNEDKYSGKKFLFYFPLFDAYVVGTYDRYDPLADELVFYSEDKFYMVSPRKTHVLMVKSPSNVE